MLHVWNIYQHLAHKWPSHVGKYTSTMEHMGIESPELNPLEDSVKVPGPPPHRLRRRFLFRRHGGEGRAAGALRDHRRFGLHRGRSDGGFRLVTLW